MSEIELRFPKPVHEEVEDRRRRKARQRAKVRKQTGTLKGRNVPRAERDDKKKLARGYVHPRSFVRLDGSETLDGIDWINRKKQLWDRGEGLCESTLEGGRRCCGLMEHPHHIIPRRDGRDDRLRNLQGVCSPCHRILDGRNPRWSGSENNP